MPCPFPWKPVCWGTGFCCHFHCFGSWAYMEWAVSFVDSIDLAWLFVHEMCKWPCPWLLGVGAFCCSAAQSCLTLCDPTDWNMPGFPVLHHLLEFVQTQVCWVSDAIQPSYPLLSTPSPALNLSQHQVFSSESALHIRWPRYWSFSFSISPASEYSGLISFRIVFLIIPVFSVLSQLLLFLLKVLVAQSCPWTIDLQAPLSMGFSRQEYWSG